MTRDVANLAKRGPLESAANENSRPVALVSMNAAEGRVDISVKAKHDSQESAVSSISRSAQLSLNNALPSHQLRRSQQGPAGVG